MIDCRMMFFNCSKNIPAFLRAKLEEASGQEGAWRPCGAFIASTERFIGGAV
jgi:hypothetical protein